MRIALAIVLVAVLGCSASSQAPTALFDGERAFGYLRAQVEIGPRVSGTPANAQTRAFIIKTLAGVGIKAVEQPFEAKTPLGVVKMVNIRATLPGQRPERIVIGSHFDTKLFKEFRFVGASDGASSTAALLELARGLKERNRPFTYELLFLDGEEAVVEWSARDSTYGSRHYVRDAQSSGTLSSIKAFILLDMIGDRNLNIRRESNSTPWLTEAIWSAARRVGHGTYFLSDTTPIEDDHLPFLEAGVPSVDIIDLDYPAWHTASDTLEHVSARSLQIVGDVVLAALPDIEQRLAKN